MANDGSSWGGTATVGGSTSTFSQSGYAVNVTIEHQAEYNRLFAIPLVGIVIRSILLIPHLIAAYILGLVAVALSLVLWIPVLGGSRYPDIGYQIVGGALRWWLRIQAYQFGLTDQYPPFGLGSADDGYPVNISWDPSASGNKLFAIPLVGYLVRSLMLIPHFFVLYFVGLVAVVLSLVMWIPVLMSGRYPDGGFSFVSGYMRWAYRTSSFMFGLTDQYPPFRLGN